MLPNDRFKIIPPSGKKMTKGRTTISQKLMILLIIANSGNSDSINIKSREPSLKSFSNTIFIFNKIDKKNAIQSNPGDIDSSTLMSGPIPIGSMELTTRKKIIAMNIEDLFRK